MNSHQAKAIPLADYLARLSFEPAYERGGALWYRSPFRPEERTPSFKVDASRNVWYDHGIGQGGTIIDLVQTLHGTTDVSRALSIIADRVGAVGNLRSGETVPAVRPALPVPGLPKPPRIETEQPVIERVGRIEDPALERYVTERAIPVELARLYLSEIHYRIGEDRYRALAFENDSQGYEVRNPYFKGSLGKKDIRFLREAGRDDAAVFEGVFDFLAALVWHGRDRAQGNVLVLNSVSLLRRGIEHLRAAELASVHAYFDHDKAGCLALAELKSALGALRLENALQSAIDVVDASEGYSGYKDVNEYVIARVMAAREA